MEAKYKLLVPEIFKPVSRPPGYTPNLVIGSGFGGAISALRLAQAGQQVTVLERGHRWPKDPWRNIFSNDTLPDGRAFWHRKDAKMLTGIRTYFDYFGGVLDSSDYPNMNVWRGACVGGGSVVFTGVMIQPQKQYFEALFGDRVNYEEMDRSYYPRVRQMLNLNAMPADIYRSKPFHHSRVWDEHVRKAGYLTTPNDSIFNWEVIRQELRGQSRPSATIGLSNHGNSNGAKFDLNQNYLAQAQATGRAAIYPGHEVLSIAWDGAATRSTSSSAIPAAVSWSVTGSAAIGSSRRRFDRQLGTAGQGARARQFAQSQRACRPRLGQQWQHHRRAQSQHAIAGDAGHPSASRIHDPAVDCRSRWKTGTCPGAHRFDHRDRLAGHRL